MIEVGDTIAVRARGVAHGGAMLAQALDQSAPATVFLRHALPGEEGRAVVTAVRSGGRLVFADLLSVTSPSADRVPAPCRYAEPGGCGGCDFQHVALPAQRALKAAVIEDCLRRIGGFDSGALPWDGAVHPVAGDEEGLRWRTRSRFTVLDDRLAMQGRRATTTVCIDDCLIARTEVVGAAERAAGRGGGSTVVAVQSSTGEVVAGTQHRLSRRTVHEQVGERRFEVAAEGFWQVHPGAPAALVGLVAAILQPQPGEALLDLYGGVGLFGGALPVAGPVHVVEGDPVAAGLAARNLRDRPDAAVHRRGVLPWLRNYRGPADLVVLDPPRSGAGAAVLGELDRLRPRAVAYVACDPAALARDLRAAVGLGWEVTALHGLDMFPMTHHVEAVAGLRPAGAPS